MGRAQPCRNGHVAAGLRGVRPARRSAAGRTRPALSVGVGAGFVFAKDAPAAGTGRRIEFRERLCALVGKMRVVDDGAGRRRPNSSRAAAAENARRMRRPRTLPHAPNGSAAEPQMRRIKDAPSGVPLDGVGAVRKEIKRCAATGQISPVPVHRYARTGATGIGPRSVRPIEGRLEDSRAP